MNHHIEADTTGAYEVELDSVAAETPSTAVCRAVAALTDRSPQSLAPLAESIDPEALDGVVGSGAGSDCRVAFSYEGYTVEIIGDERIRLQSNDRSVGR